MLPKKELFPKIRNINFYSVIFVINKIFFMDKSLLDHFEKKFNENFKSSASYKEAFDKTNEELGFQAYKNYPSFSCTRARRRRKR